MTLFAYILLIALLVPLTLLLLVLVEGRRERERKPLMRPIPTQDADGNFMCILVRHRED